MTIASLCLPCTLFAQSDQELSLGEQPIFKVSRTVEPIVVDGLMNEKSWKSTEARSFDYFYRVDQPDDQQQTTLRMLGDEQTLYLFYDMKDKFLTAREMQRDGQPY
ncbi:MAG: hypothetical protein HKN47_27415, partial [Pirellulaceae bacterium]|nr:hypothetical protein [Pirellulaceae bacterium]